MLVIAGATIGKLRQFIVQKLQIADFFFYLFNTATSQAFHFPTTARLIFKKNQASAVLVAVQ